MPPHVPVGYRLDLTGERMWCRIHNRRADFIRSGPVERRCCDPRLGGILLPCVAIPASQVKPEMAPTAGGDRPDRPQPISPPPLPPRAGPRPGAEAPPVPEPGKTVLGPATPMFGDHPPDDTSPMQQAVLDSGATPVEGNRFAFQTNEGTVFLASPADMARESMMDSMMSAKWANSYKPSNPEIDRMMKEDRDE